MQLGFVIDHSRCIGCHACTVACKSENDVPLGSFRTWVKYTEEGQFPAVKRSFGVLRCNQCTNAPCVTICPVTALHKRVDGIVDIDPKACIGCKACMQGCPYDALYINEDRGVAEKCHFCAHRTERGLAPACAVVCPTEAIIPGDFHDPTSVVSALRDEHQLSARKVEAGTGPNVWYRDVQDAAIDPTKTDASGGYLWAQAQDVTKIDAELTRVLEQRAEARTVYDVDHKPWWGWRVTAYLLAKGLGAGAFLVGMFLLPPFREAPVGLAAIWVPILALIGLAITGAVLVADLKRPERFYLLFLRPNWNSWLARGTFVITAYGMLLTAWLLLGLTGRNVHGAIGWLLTIPTALGAALTAGYTGFLFGQAKGRVLWMQQGLWLHLILQAMVAGGAGLLIVRAFDASLTGPTAATAASWALFVGLVGHGLFALLESRLAPAGREREYHRVSALLTRGPFARAHWIGLGLSVLLPLIALFLLPASAAVAVLVGVGALLGLWLGEDAFVRAGQATAIS